MKSCIYKDDELELSAEVANEGILCLKMSGDLGKSKIEALKKFSDDVKNITKDLYNENEDLRVLIDASKVHEIDSESLSELYDLMMHNSKFVSKAAVFGANYFTRIIVELAIHITKRKNMKIFKTREEAMEYLLS